MVHGLSLLCMPSLCRQQFSQNTELYAISTINRWGSCSNGNMFVVALILSFIFRMYCSISGTCSSRAVVFRLIPVISICFLMHLNCLYTRMCRTLKPLMWYALITCWSDLMIVDFLSSLIISIVPNHIALESVTMNGILLMYIISVASVMFPCSSSIPSGRSSSVLIVTLSGVFRVVLHFSEPRFGPSMSSALRMSHFVIGQFGIRPLSTYSI